MCLTRVDETPKMTEGEGFKRFLKCPRGKLGGYFFNGPRLVEGRWLRDRSKKTIMAMQTGKEYPRGFHVKETASWGSCDLVYTNRRVSFRKVVATGEEYGETVIVAKEMYIHPEEKADVPV